MQESFFNAENKANKLRLATFNVAFDRAKAGVLNSQLRRGGHPQISAVAEILQRVRPDIVLLNEFDHDGLGLNRQGVRDFIKNYLAIAQNGAEPISYGWFYVAATNTGELTPFDLDADGVPTLPRDAYGFGNYHGQYGFVVLSQFPIEYAKVRTFRLLPWAAMPNSLLPSVAHDLSAEAYKGMRLSSKNHIDLPIKIAGKTLHILAAHPAPPIAAKLNIARNHDEIRLFADFIDPTRSAWICDDRGKRGGLAPDQSFVLLGDFNADPNEGDSVSGAIEQLLLHPRVHPFAQKAPHSLGGMELAFALNPNLPSERGAAWTQIHPLRLDYVIPSADLIPLASEVYWEPLHSPLRYLFANAKGEQGKTVSSDHRLVWLDLAY